MGGHAPVNQQETELVIRSVFVPSVTSSPEMRVSDFIKIFPNSFSGKTTMEMPANFGEGMLSVQNLTGQEILKQTLTEKKTEIDLRGNSPGLYFVKLIHNKGVESIKVLKK